MSKFKVIGFVLLTLLLSTEFAYAWWWDNEDEVEIVQNIIRITDDTGYLVESLGEDKYNFSVIVPLTFNKDNESARKDIVKNAVLHYLATKIILSNTSNFIEGLRVKSKQAEGSEYEISGAVDYLTLNYQRMIGSIEIIKKKYPISSTTFKDTRKNVTAECGFLIWKRKCEKPVKVLAIESQDVDLNLASLKLSPSIYNYATNYDSIYTASALLDETFKDGGATKGQFLSALKLDLNKAESKPRKVSIATDLYDSECKRLRSQEKCKLWSEDIRKQVKSALSSTINELFGGGTSFNISGPKEETKPTYSYALELSFKKDSEGWIDDDFVNYLKLNGISFNIGDTSYQAKWKGDDKGNDQFYLATFTLNTSATCTWNSGQSTVGKLSAVSLDDSGKTLEASWLASGNVKISNNHCNKVEADHKTTWVMSVNFPGHIASYIETTEFLSRIKGITPLSANDALEAMGVDNIVPVVELKVDHIGGGIIGKIVTIKMYSKPGACQLEELLISDSNSTLNVLLKNSLEDGYFNDSGTTFIQLKDVVEQVKSGSWKTIKKVEKCHGTQVNVNDAALIRAVPNDKTKKVLYIYNHKSGQKSLGYSENR
ncbi:MAG: hypothetical protein methR_P2763 [Methyloprofundus sp.]|nr:MAG: hypothetical protein methR_P2763 [Methyloprofundus sp.]